MINLEENKFIFSQNFIIEKLKKVASNNNIEWKDSFFKWENKKFDYNFSTSLPIFISFKNKKKFSEIFFEIKENFFEIIDYLNIIESSKGYLNFSFKESFYRKFINFLIKSPFYFCRKKNIKINIEFLSANPTGYIHVGHLRNALIGNTIASIYSFLGFDVTREYYINDKGKQIDDLIDSVVFHCNNKFLKLNSLVEKLPTYSGKSIEDISYFLLEVKKIEISKINKKDEKIREIVVDFFLEKIKIDLEKFGVRFDNWFSEKNMFNNEKNRDFLNFILKSDFSYKKDNAFFLKTSVFGDEKDRVIIKSNGDFTYFTSDIIYHIDKLSRSDFLVNIWGSDHHGYVDRLKSSLKILGFNDIEKSLKFVLIQMVGIMSPNGPKKLSKRMGNLITIDDTESLIKKDQLKFCLLETDPNNHVLINTKILNEENEKSKLYYIQYANARCDRIIFKWKNIFSSNVKNSERELIIDKVFLLNDSKEKKIINQLMNFERIIFESAEQKKPHLLLNYLYYLSSDFHSYYESIPILKNENYEVNKQRVILVSIVKKIISKGLEICSISQNIEK